MVIVMRNTIVGGRNAGLQTSLGVLCGNLVHISYCLIGIGWVISQSILAFSVIKYAGAAYLVYLGVMSFRSNNVALPDPATVQKTAMRAWYLQGLINNVLNPKGTLFYLGVFTLVITPDTTAATSLLLVTCMLLISAVFWLQFVYALDQTAVRRLIERSQRIVSTVFGAMLITLGIRVALLDR